MRFELVNQSKILQHTKKNQRSKIVKFVLDEIYKNWTYVWHVNVLKMTIYDQFYIAICLLISYWWATGGFVNNKSDWIRPKVCGVKWIRHLAKLYSGIHETESKKFQQVGVSTLHNILNENPHKYDFLKNISFKHGERSWYALSYFDFLCFYRLL